MQSDKEPFLPFSRPSIGEEEIAEVVACLKSGWITTGPRCERLENDFKALTGSKFAIALSSCTAALHVAYLALGCGPGDEVILPTLTWPSTANMVVATGATPVFADIDPHTWNIDPESVAKRLTKKTKVVVPVHYAGQAADLDRIREVLQAAGRSDVAILEDAAHAAGTSYKGRVVGGCTANGTAAVCFSFHPIKNMTTGEGAVVTTDDEKLNRLMKLWKFHGVERDAWKAYAGAGAKPATSYDVVLPGFKYNLTDLQAALGIHQLAKLPGFNKRRAEIAARYDAGFAGEKSLVRPGRASYDNVHPWHLYAILAPKLGRADFIERTKAMGVGTGLHFEAVHLATYYREKFGCAEGDCPVAEDVCSRIVSLPIYPSMTDEDADRTIRVVKEALRARG